MTGKEFKLLAETLSRYTDPRATSPMFVQASGGRLKFVTGNGSGTMIAEAGEIDNLATLKFFVNAKPFIALGKNAKAKDVVTFAVGPHLEVEVNTLPSRFMRIDASLRDFIMPTQDVSVTIPHQGLTQAWRMLSSLHTNHRYSKHVSVAYVDGNAAFVANSNYAAAGWYLPSEPFELQGLLEQDFVNGWKTFETPGDIRLSDSGVQIRSGIFTAVGRLLGGSPWPLEAFPEPTSGVSVTYERKPLIEALKSVSSDDPYYRITLACTPDGKHHVGRYQGGDWVAVKAKGKPFSQPKTLRADLVLKLLNAMEGKSVTLRWDEGPDRQDPNGATLEAHHVFFTNEEMKAWRILLAPVARG